MTRLRDRIELAADHMLPCACHTRSHRTYTARTWAAAWLYRRAGIRARYPITRSELLARLRQRGKDTP